MIGDVADEAANVYLFIAASAFNFVAAIAYIFQQQLVSIKFGGVATFAFVAVTGNEFFVLQAFVRLVDFPKLVADSFEEGLFVAAADLDVDFFFGIVFDDLRTCPVVGEDDAVSPKVVLIWDERMRFYDEAGEDAFGHEVVAVAQDEVVGGVPVVCWLADGEELGARCSGRVGGGVRRRA